MTSALRKKLVVLGAFSLLVAGCSGGSDADPTTTEAPTTTTSTPPTSTTTTSSTTTSSVPVETAQQLADRVIVTQAEAPAGYTVADDDDDDESEAACDGVDNVRDRFTAEGERSVEIDGPGHFFRAQVFVYASAEDAMGAFAYAEEIATLCDGRTTTDDEGSVARLEFGPISLPDLPSDDLGGYELTVLTPEVGVVAAQFFIRSGNVALVSVGTDADTVVALLETMAAKLTGDTPAVIAAPTGAAPLVPGLGGDGDLAALLRAAIADVDDISNAATSWLENATDAEVDALAVSACDELDLLGDDDDANEALGRLYLALDDEDRQALDPTSYGELVGGALVVYCPDVFSKLG